MQLEYAIIHELEKEQNEREGVIKLSDTILSNNEINTEFIMKLHELFTNKSYNYSYAYFKDNSIEYNDPNYKKEFSDYLNEFLTKTNESNFHLLTKNLMICLKDEIRNIMPAKGGYLVFSIYSTDKNRIFSINLIRKTDTFTINEGDTTSIKPELIEHLDLDKFAMACQIDLYKVIKEPSKKYLKFTKNSRMSDVSDYFYNWINIDRERLSDNRENNDALVRIINTITPLPIIDGQELDRDEFKKRIFTYFNSLPDKNISLYELGNRFYPDNDSVFINYANFHSINIDSEFKTNNSILKKLWKYDVSVDNIRLAFDYKVREKIEVFEDNVLIRSPKLARSVNAALHEE